MPGKDGAPIRLSWCNWAASALGKSGGKSSAKHSDCPGVHPENPAVRCDCACHRKAAA